MQLRQGFTEFPPEPTEKIQNPRLEIWLPVKDGGCVEDQPQRSAKRMVSKPALIRFSCSAAAGPYCP
jgi:hypothetical protein